MDIETHQAAIEQLNLPVDQRTPVQDGTDLPAPEEEGITPAEVGTLVETDFSPAANAPAPVEVFTDESAVVENILTDPAPEDAPFSMGNEEIDE